MIQGYNPEMYYYIRHLSIYFAKCLKNVEEENMKKINSSNGINVS